MWLNWVFDYVWFTEYQSPMEINDSQDRAPFGDLTNHASELHHRSVDVGLEFL